MKKFLKYTFLLLTVLLVSATAYNYWPETPLPTDKPIDRIVVEKSIRRMHVMNGEEVLKTYKISLGRNPVGAKEFEGDKRTPEGVYTINDKNAQSGYYLNLGISYPNAVDLSNAEKFNYNPGGDIKIHGLRNKLGFIGKLHRLSDWTLGCIAITNDEIQELFDNVPIGTVIEIRE